MSSGFQGSLEISEKELPYSKMVFPANFPDQLKYSFWRFYTPFHPFFRDLSLSLGILAHEGRQNFYIGKVVPEKNIRDVVGRLIEQGYGNHFVAWKDEGEVVSLRRVEGFQHQYHIRIFEDGEVRGHYEYTPEYRPILHWKAVGQKDCTPEFAAILKGYIA